MRAIHTFEIKNPENSEEMRHDINSPGDTTFYFALLRDSLDESDGALLE